MTESTNKPDLANAKKIGGGGAEPDGRERQPDNRPEPERAGAGVDLKTSELPD
jgi:hypothetical protein